jgi:hypothetical protein|tara:strand:+ start:30 stop:1904 length:1875 start_codon:yes stop_codon:yes gene_type:complete
MSNFPESNKGYTLDGTPLSEKPLGSANLAKAIAAMEAPTHLPSPCGEGQMGKINIELQKFFETLKGIKKYANVYVNGSINAIQNVTSLIRNTSTIIAGVMKVITKRIRDFIIQQIREAIDMVVDTIFPTQVKGLRNTIVQQIIDQIFCAFKDIVGSLKNLAGDFLFELIGKAANAPFCAAEQYTNALVNNLAANIDNAITPLLSEINDVLGGVTSVMGSVFEALDFILGFQSMTCMKPNCPEILQFKASPWGGPSQKQVDDFNKFIEPLNKLPSADDVIAGVDAYIGNLEVFDGKKLGDAPTDPNITRCVTDPFKCGPPTIDLFGGGGVGAVAEIVVDNIGTAIGANLISGGRGYTRPPFVTINDSCGNSYLNGYSNIDDDPSSPTFGQVTDIIFTTTPVVPPRDGSDETNPTGGSTGPNNTIDNTGTPQDPDDPNNTGGVVDDPNNTDGVVDDPSQFGSDYVVCLEGFRVVSMGIGYTPNDIFEIDPDIPNLSVTIKLTEVGQVIDVQLAERICGLTTYPDVDINSDTGNGVIIEPILSFIKINDFEDEDDGDDAEGVDDGVADDGADGEFISINTDFVIQAEIAKNDIEGFITTLRGKKLITEKQQKEFTRRNVIQIVDCIT